MFLNIDFQSIMQKKLDIRRQRRTMKEIEENEKVVSRAKEVKREEEKPPVKKLSPVVTRKIVETEKASNSPPAVKAGRQKSAPFNSRVKAVTDSNVCAKYISCYLNK